LNPDPDLVDRILSLPGFSAMPREEVAWLVQHGRIEVHQTGAVIAPKGKRIENLWILLSGQMSVRVDRGAGPRQVIEWGAGGVSGMLPYSRMKGPPGDNRIDETTELLAIHERCFPEMIHRCPTFTARTVHLMLDRAREFNTSDLQDEKMISLGKLAAGLAHELNNPASATLRSAKLLREGLPGTEVAARALGAAGLSDEQLEAIERLCSACLSGSGDALLSPLQRADREDEIANWLIAHRCDPDHASALAETSVTLAALDSLAALLTGKALDVAIAALAARCATDSLAVDIERAAARIYELVAAIKRFTQMDNLAAPESVEVESGLRDTLRIVRSKAKQKDAAVSLEVAPDLPAVHATAGELNQVWLNLLDNALDAIPQAGTIEIRACRRGDRVEVRVIDNGPGIPEDILSRIFDPFFTTKPPGEGTGLGLDISRRLVRRYDGEIAVESRPGRTELVVRLPIASATATAGT